MRLSSTAAALLTSLLFRPAIISGQGVPTHCRYLFCAHYSAGDGRISEPQVLRDSADGSSVDFNPPPDVRAVARGDSAHGVGRTEWEIVPSVGAGFVFIHQRRTLSTVNAHVEVSLRTGGWRWGPFASTREVGIICGDGCSGAWAVGIGVARHVSWVWLGVGVAALKRFGEWHRQSHVVVSLENSRFQLQVRGERAQSVRGLYVPLLIGLKLP